MRRNSFFFDYWLYCLLFGAVFMYSGVVKLWGLGPINFTNDIRSFHVLEDPWVAWLAMSLPWLEVLGGAAVGFGFMRRGGLAILIACLLVFLGAIIQAWSRGIDISCGCFGKSSGTSSIIELVIRDVALLVFGFYLWVAGKKRIFPSWKRDNLG